MPPKQTWREFGRMDLDIHLGQVRLTFYDQDGHDIGALLLSPQRGEELADGLIEAAEEARRETPAD